MAKHSNLADAALAGLASKENFRKVNLRSVKSTEVVTNNSTLPFNKLMLICIKGQGIQIPVKTNPKSKKIGTTPKELNEHLHTKWTNQLNFTLTFWQILK